jgi:hypothetical protein
VIPYREDAMLRSLDRVAVSLRVAVSGTAQAGGTGRLHVHKL